jgi:hypothetical protein
VDESCQPITATDTCIFFVRSICSFFLHVWPSLRSTCTLALPFSTHP